MRGSRNESNKRYKACEYVAYIVQTECTIRECAKVFTKRTRKKVYPGTVYVYAARYFREMYPDHPFNQKLRNIWAYHKKHYKSKWDDRL